MGMKHVFKKLKERRWDSSWLENIKHILNLPMGMWKNFFFPLQTMICKRKPLIKMNLKLKLDSFMENQLWITSLLKTCPQTYKSYHMKNIFPLLSVNPRRVCIVASEERQREYIQNPKLRKTGVDTWMNNFFYLTFLITEVYDVAFGWLFYWG